jgi:hypothetical protein
MKKILITIIIICLGGYLILFFYREYKIKSRSHFITAYAICNNFKVEKFKVFSLSDLYCDYLTDSLNFRVFIDTYQDDEDILYECKEDSIFINKVDRADNKKIIEHKFFTFSSLKSKSNYK